tara:strand:+ start:1139 stop:1372 length:234 start_codon:yes stop_codon:yes gene_type:complete
MTDNWVSLGFTKISKNDYKYFSSWLFHNMKELYANKIAYEVRWDEDKDDNAVWVKLYDESFISIDQILIDMKKYHLT